MSAMVHRIGPGSEIDGFRLGEMIHTGSMATVFRLAGPQGPLPLIMKIPRLGPGERAVNVIGFEVCRMVLGALEQGPHYPTLVAYGDVETTPYLVMEYIEGARLHEWLARAPLPFVEVARLGSALAIALRRDRGRGRTVAFPFASPHFVMCSSLFTIYNWREEAR